ncbi:MAG: hypothetical protein QM756_43300 [Polyangiaceae bacterium]
MPLIFVHGVATRPTEEYQAAVFQRDALFRSLVFESETAKIINPDWGSAGVEFDPTMPWLPKYLGNQKFGHETGLADGANDATVALGRVAGRDTEQAIDLIVMAALGAAIKEATLQQMPESAGVGSALELAKTAGMYLEQKALSTVETPISVEALVTSTNLEFVDALAHELSPITDKMQIFGFGDTIRDALAHLGGQVVNFASDIAIMAKRSDLSRSASIFLGDIFVYLREHANSGPGGTRHRIFKPIIDALVAGARSEVWSQRAFRGRGSQPWRSAAIRYSD